MTDPLLVPLVLLLLVACVGVGVLGLIWGCVADLSAAIRADLRRSAAEDAAWAARAQAGDPAPTTVLTVDELRAWWGEE